MSKSFGFVWSNLIFFSPPVQVTPEREGLKMEAGLKKTTKLSQLNSLFWTNWSVTLWSRTGTRWRFSSGTLHLLCSPSRHLRSSDCRICLSNRWSHMFSLLKLITTCHCWCAGIPRCWEGSTAWVSTGPPESRRPLCPWCWLIREFV